MTQVSVSSNISSATDVASAFTTVVAPHPVQILRIEHAERGTGPRDLLFYEEDFLNRFNDPSMLSGPIGQFFQSSVARARKNGEIPANVNTRYCAETKPWFFGVAAHIDLSVFFSEELQNVLDEFGFQLALYVPALGSYLIEDDQIAFIKEQATRVWVSGVREGIAARCRHVLDASALALTA